MIELLLVVTIVGIVSVIAIPSFQKGIRSADNGAIYATLRSVSTTQVSFYSQNGRFARLSELNALHGDSLGTPSGTRLVRGRFNIQMSPATPTDEELRIGYRIVATGDNGVPDPPYIFSLTQTGDIVQEAP